MLRLSELQPGPSGINLRLLGLQVLSDNLPRPGPRRALLDSLPAQAHLGSRARLEPQLSQLEREDSVDLLRLHLQHLPLGKLRHLDLQSLHLPLVRTCLDLCIAIEKLIV